MITRSKTPRLSKQQQIDASRDQALNLIRRMITPIQARGFYGEVPMVLKLQDGLITMVELTGPKEQARVVLPAA